MHTSSNISSQRSLVVLWMIILHIVLFLQVLASDNFKFGYNAATGKYEDLMAAGIIDPTKVGLHTVTTSSCDEIFVAK